MRINNHICPLGSVGTRRSNSYQLLAGLSHHYASGDPAVMESALWNQQPALGPATDSLSADRVLRMSLDARSPKRRPQSPLTRPRVWRPMAAPPPRPAPGRISSEICEGPPLALSRCADPALRYPPRTPLRRHARDPADRKKSPGGTSMRQYKLSHCAADVWREVVAG